MNIRQISEAFQIKAVAELNEDPKRIEEEIDHIKEWLEKQPHLIARKDDQFLLCFLRGCKFSLQKTKEKLDNFYTARAILSEYFFSRDPFDPTLQLILNAGGVLPLPKSTELTGSRIILFRWAVLNPATMPFPMIMKVLYMMIDMLIEEDDNTVISGLHFLGDLKGFSPSYTLQFTPNALHRAGLGVQSAYPLRMKGLDMINVPSFFDMLYSVIKPVLGQKLRSRTRVFTESNIHDLYNWIPQNILPKEYGGTAESLDQIRDKWKMKVENYSNWFKEDAKYYCNEELRVEESKSDVFGPEGTFRKLNLD